MLYGKAPTGVPGKFALMFSMGLMSRALIREIVQRMWLGGGVRLGLIGVELRKPQNPRNGDAAFQPVHDPSLRFVLAGAFLQPLVLVHRLLHLRAAWR